QKTISLLRCAALGGELVIQFEPLEGRRFRRIESKFPDLFAEEIALFRMMIQTACLYLVRPTLDFLWRFWFAILFQPFHYFLVAGALLDLRFKVLATHTFEAEKHVIQRAVKVVVADVSGHQGTAFINGASEDRIAANADARASRCLFP